MSTGRRVATVAVGAAVLVIAVVVFARLVHVRSLLGISTTTDAFEPGPCPDAEDVLLPRGAESAAGRWRRLPPLPLARDELRAAALGDLIYVGSGLEEKRPGSDLTSINDFLVFDPNRGTYRRLEPLPRRVDHPALVGTGGHLYLVGGWHDNRPTDEVFRYSPATQEWATLASMPTARASPAAAAIGDRIYVAGGSPAYHRGAVAATRTLEIYDMRTGRWSRGSDMPTARHHAGAAAVGGKLYVVGGRRGGKLSLAAVERYDPATDRWQRMAPLPLRVGGVAAVGAAGRVIAAGGGDDEEDWLTPATWALAPSRNRWQRLADLQVPRHGHSLAALDGVAYTFGGSPCPGYAATDAAEALDLR